MSEEGARTESLDLDERSRLELQLLAKRRDRAKETAIQPLQDRGGPLPLSSAQQRLWFIQSLEPTSSAYNVFQCYRVRGPLDVTALRRALEDIVSRHETLRSTFPAVRRHPHVSADPGVYQGLSVIEIPESKGSDREAEALKILKDEAKAPFNLAHGPVFRPTLIVLGPQDHFLLFALHHIACDELSLRNLYEEVRAAYRAHSDGMRSDLPILPVQYSDFAQWQRNQLSNGAYDNSRRYWKAALKDVPQNFTIPYDATSENSDSSGSQRHHWLIPPDIADGLDRLGKETSSTPFVTMFAVFLVALHHWGRSDDIVVGTPTADRQRPELEPLIGYFANTLVMRVDAGGDPPFRQFLGRVQRCVLDGIDHQDLPFEQVVEVVNPERKHIGNPIFKLMFTHRKVTPLTFSDSTLRITEVELNRQEPKCDMWLSVKDGKDGRSAALVYDSRLYRRFTVERFAADLNHVLRQVVSGADPHLSALGANLAGAEPHREGIATHQLRGGDRDDRLAAEPVPAPGEDKDQTLRMLDIWRRVIGTKNISADDDFFVLGGHSMLALELFAQIDQEFGISLPLSALFEAPTVSALIRRIREAPNPAAMNLVVPMQPLGGKDPIFAVPSGGNSVLMYQSLAQCLGTDRPFYGLEHPGMSDGKVLETVEEIASRHIQELRSLHPDRSCILIGNCSGALVAFELARRLVAEGRKVRQLILVGPPNIDKLTKWSKVSRRWNRVIANLTALGELHGSERLYYLDDRMGLVRERVLRWFSGQPDIPENHQRVYDASQKATKSYAAGRYEGEVMLVFGMRQALAGWQKVCANPPKVCRYYGAIFRKDRYPPIEADPGGHIREFLEREG